jgi:hypothetical protein
MRGSAPTVLVLTVGTVLFFNFWTFRSPSSDRGSHGGASENLEASSLLRARRTASKAAEPAPLVEAGAPALLHQSQPPQSAARSRAWDPALQEAAALTVLPQPLAQGNRAATSSVGDAAGARVPVGGAPFWPGQSEQARTSVQKAIDKQRPPPGNNELWGGVQSGWEQANKESDNVRALLQADGMRKWTPDPALLPPRRPANASMDQLLEHVPIGGHAWLAFGNAGVSEMLLNWAAHVLQLGAGWQMVIAAFDVPLLLSLHAHGLPCYNYSGALPATHFRHAPYLFHRMGFLKAELIVHVLRTGRHALVSDSDVVWIADPRPLLDALHAKGTTLAASTDCLDVEADRDKTARPSAPTMCGYNPGNTGGAVFNTGVLWFAAAPSSIAFASEWALGTLALTDPYSDDQGVFNRLILRGLHPVVSHSPEGDVIRGADGLRVAPLPSDRFCSGHLVWVQQASEVRRCLSVHTTFTEYGDAGKRWRLLESRLWALNEPEYYSEGRFLTFVPPRAPADPMPCTGEAGKYVVGGDPPEACGGEDPSHGLGRKRFGDIMWHEAMKRSVRLRANHALMSRQVHALRDALGIARVLNRTLILPHYDCICDRSEDVAIVPSCIYHGAPPRLQVPFKCSQHFVADTHKLQMMALDPTRFGMQPHKFGGLVTRPLRLRAHSFLADERTAPEIRGGVREVCVGAGCEGGGGVTMQKGATNEEVKALLGGGSEAARSRVLRLSDAEGAFGGWVSDATEAKLFSTMMDYYVHRGAWCCSSRNQAQQDDGRVYVRPPPELRGVR